jgi:hypothetical protein
VAVRAADFVQEFLLGIVVDDPIAREMTYTNINGITDEARERANNMGMSQAEAMERQAAAMLDRAAQIRVLEEQKRERWGWLIDAPDETVVFFKKRFNAVGQLYTYAMVKVNGTWYTTGPRSPKNYSNDEIIKFLDGGYNDTGQLMVEDLWVVNEWVKPAGWENES